MNIFRLIRYIATPVICLALSGCVSMALQSALEPTIENLQRQTDLELVCDGAPAYLLMIDGFVLDNPSRKMLLTATQSYTAYSSVLEECGRPGRASRVSIKAKEYASALLDSLPQVKGMSQRPLPDFKKALAAVNGEDIDVLFWGAYGWAIWIKHQQGAPAAISDLYKVEQLMNRCLELDETYYHGGIHLFLGTYHGLRPKMYGGKPEKSRNHFERALAISNRQFLAVQVAYADSYARMTFNRELYVSLLEEVIQFPLKSRPKLALSNQAAKQKAQRLLEKVDDIF